MTRSPETAGGAAWKDSGSYAPGDVTFLLRPLELTPVPLEERERLIQSGRRHYSEMIGPEDAPGRERMRLFREALAMNGARLARDLAVLAGALAASARGSGGELALVSIARAGTPVGVLLLRRLREVAPELRVAHYSLSVIRDRGLDMAALRWILQRHPAGSVRFLDGWTGKGTIARELRASLPAGGQEAGLPGPGLWVPLDVCGVAEFAAGTRDYLIPSTLLGGTISGLISRSVLPDPAVEDFHGCVRLDHLRRYDVTRWFVRHMMALLAAEPVPAAGEIPELRGGDPRREEAALACVREMMTRHALADANRVKLGIGETVRVLLRRLPEMVWLNPAARAEDAGLIRRLAALRGVPVELEAGLPFDAVAVIANAGGRGKVGVTKRMVNDGAAVAAAGEPARASSPPGGRPAAPGPLDLKPATPAAV